MSIQSFVRNEKKISYFNKIQNQCIFECALELESVLLLFGEHSLVILKHLCVFEINSILVLMLILY